MEDFESFCRNTQNATTQIRQEAEANLRLFAQKEDSLNICRLILEQSSEQIALFHAVIIIRSTISSQSFSQKYQEKQDWTLYFLMYITSRYLS